MEISGKTQVMFMLCDPVFHIRGSVLLNSWLDADGIDATIIPIHVDPKDLGTVLSTVRHLQNVVGLGITIPHKIAVTDHLDHLSDEAERVGSANFVRRDSSGELVGTNIDGEGFIRGCLTRGISMTGKKVLHLGAGGAGRATAFAIARAGASQLDIWNRTSAKAKELAAEIGQHYPATKCGTIDAIDVSGFDVLVNTTPAGMEGFEPLEFQLTAEHSSLDVADIIVNPAVTPLLAQAQALGLRTSPGSDMLRGQYELMRDFIGLVKK